MSNDKLDIVTLKYYLSERVIPASPLDKYSVRGKTEILKIVPVFPPEIFFQGTWEGCA